MFFLKAIYFFGFFSAGPVSEFLDIALPASTRIVLLLFRFENLSFDLDAFLLFMVSSLRRELILLIILRMALFLSSRGS